MLSKLEQSKSILSPNTKSLIRMSTSHKSKFSDINKYNKDKFSQWQKLFLINLAETPNLYELTVGQLQKPTPVDESAPTSEESKVMAMYDRLNRILTVALSKSCELDEIAVGIITDDSTSSRFDGKAKYDALCNFHNAPTAQNRFAAVKAFTGIKFIKGTDSEENYKLRLNEAYQRVVNLQVTWEDIKIVVYLSGLPAEYNPFVTSISLRSNLKFDQVCLDAQSFRQSILLKEREEDYAEARIGKKVDEESYKEFLRFKRMTEKEDLSFKGRCYNCNKTGHMAVDCNLPDQRTKKKVHRGRKPQDSEDEDTDEEEASSEKKTQNVKAKGKKAKANVAVVDFEDGEGAQEIEITDFEDSFLSIPAERIQTTSVVSNKTAKAVGVRDTDVAASASQGWQLPQWYQYSDAIEVKKLADKGDKHAIEIMEAQCRVARCQELVSEALRRCKTSGNPIAARKKLAKAQERAESEVSGYLRRYGATDGWANRALEVHGALAAKVKTAGQPRKLKSLSIRQAVRAQRRLAQEELTDEAVQRQGESSEEEGSRGEGEWSASSTDTTEDQDA